MANSIQFGWMVPPAARFFRPSVSAAEFPGALRRTLDLICDSFDGVWVTDHLQFDEHNVFECWTTTTYLAALYPSLTVGTIVLNQSFRNPALLAIAPNNWRI